MDTADEEVDLYLDLEDPFFPVEKESSPVQPTPPTISTEELDQIKDQNTKFGLQNKALKKNISCLFKTARLEIDRKEITIKGLEERVKDLECILQFSINIGSSIFGSESVPVEKHASGNGCLDVQEGMSDNGFTTVTGSRETEASVVQDVAIKQDSAGCSTPQTDRRQLKHAGASSSSAKEKPHHSQHVENTGRQSSQPLECDSDGHDRLVGRHCKTGERPDKFDLRRKLQSGRSPNVDRVHGSSGRSEKTSKTRQSDRDKTHHRPASKHHSRYSSSPTRRHKLVDDGVGSRGVERSPLRSRRRSSRTREGRKRGRRQSLSPGRERERSRSHLPHPRTSAERYRDEKYHHRPIRHSPHLLRGKSERDSPIASRPSNDVDDDTFSTISHCTLGSLDDACVGVCDFDESYDVSDAPHNDDDTISLEDGEIRDDLSDAAGEDGLSNVNGNVNVSSCAGADDRSSPHSPSHAHKVALSPCDTTSSSSAGVGTPAIRSHANQPAHDSPRSCDSATNSDTIKLLDCQSPCDDSQSPQDTALDSHVESEMDGSPDTPQQTGPHVDVDSEVDSAPRHIVQGSHVEVDSAPQHIVQESHVEVDNAPQHTVQGSHVDNAPQHTVQGSHVDTEVDSAPQHTVQESHVEVDNAPQHIVQESHVEVDSAPQHIVQESHVEVDSAPQHTVHESHVEVDSAPHTAHESHVDLEVDGAPHVDMDESQHTLLGSPIDSEMTWNQSPPLGSCDPPQSGLKLKPHSEDTTPPLTALGSHISSETYSATPQLTSLDQAGLHWYPATPDLAALGSHWDKPDLPRPEVNPQWDGEARSHWDEPDPHWDGESPGTPDLASLQSHWDRPPQAEVDPLQDMKYPGTPELAALCSISLAPVHNERSSRFMPFDLHCSDSLLDALGSISSKELGCNFPSGATASDLPQCSGHSKHSLDLTLQPDTPVTDFTGAFKTLTPTSPVSGRAGRHSSCGTLGHSEHSLDLTLQPDTPVTGALNTHTPIIPVSGRADGHSCGTLGHSEHSLDLTLQPDTPVTDFAGAFKTLTPTSPVSGRADGHSSCGTLGHSEHSLDLTLQPDTPVTDFASAFKQISHKTYTPTSPVSGRAGRHSSCGTLGHSEHSLDLTLQPDTPVTDFASAFKQNSHETDTPTSPGRPEPAELSTHVSPPATPTPVVAAPGDVVHGSREPSVEVMGSSEVEVVELMVGGGGGGRGEQMEGGEDAEEMDQDVETECGDELEEGEVSDSSEDGEGDTLPPAGEDSSVVYLDDLTNLINTEGWENELEAITRVNRMKKPLLARKHSCDDSSDSNDGRANASARSSHSCGDQQTIAHRSRNNSAHSVSTRTHSRHSHDKKATQGVHSRLGARVGGHEHAVRERGGPEVRAGRHRAHRSRSPHHPHHNHHHSKTAQSARQLRHHLERPRAHSRLRTKH